MARVGVGLRGATQASFPSELSGYKISQLQTISTAWVFSMVLFAVVHGNDRMSRANVQNALKFFDIFRIECLNSDLGRFGIACKTAENMTKYMVFFAVVGFSRAHLKFFFSKLFCFLFFYIPY